MGNCFFSSKIKQYHNVIDKTNDIIDETNDVIKQTNINKEINKENFRQTEIHKFNNEYIEKIINKYIDDVTKYIIQNFNVNKIIYSNIDKIKKMAINNKIKNLKYVSLNIIFANEQDVYFIHGYFHHNNENLYIAKIHDKSLKNSSILLYDVIIENTNDNIENKKVHFKENIFYEIDNDQNVNFNFKLKNNRELKFNVQLENIKNDFILYRNYSEMFNK